MPTAHPLEKQPDRRHHIVGWAHFGVLYNKHFTYSEGDDRMEYLTHNARPGSLAPDITTDCSGFVRLLYFWGGAPDPMGSDYKEPEGYTGTLVDNGVEIPLEKVQPGDIIIYGPGTGWHTALVVASGPNPMTVSMGEQGDPHFVKVSQDGREPQRYFRFETRQRLDFE
jgi:hypothetical protein